MDVLKNTPRLPVLRGKSADVIWGKNEKGDDKENKCEK
jgi:hypothetical protein